MMWKCRIVTLLCLNLSPLHSVDACLQQPACLCFQQRIWGGVTIIHCLLRPWSYSETPQRSSPAPAGLFQPLGHGKILYGVQQCQTHLLSCLFKCPFQTGDSLHYKIKNVVIQPKAFSCADVCHVNMEVFLNFMFSVFTASVFMKMIHGRTTASHLMLSRGKLRLPRSNLK